MPRSLPHWRPAGTTVLQPWRPSLKVPRWPLVAVLCCFSGVVAQDETVEEPVGSVVGEHVPTELPGPGFPGATAAQSNAAWPSGRQPERLEAWPQTGKGTEKRTLHVCWKKTILRDVAKGWEDICVHLFHAASRKDAESCESTCWNDPRCPVWQFNRPASGAPDQCWMGYGTDCGTRNGDQNPPFQVLAGQRLQHGDVRVLQNMSGAQVKNLYNLGVFHNASQAEGITRCRNWCYSLISCEYWQYGQFGCWVDAPFFSTGKGMHPDQVVQYPLTVQGLRGDIHMVAGEYIQHYCPPSPVSTSRAAALVAAAAAAHVAPPTQTPRVVGMAVQAQTPAPAAATELPWGSIWVWGGLAIAVILGLAIIAGLVIGSSDRFRDKSRAVHREPSEESMDQDGDGYQSAEEDRKPLISAAPTAGRRSTVGGLAGAPSYEASRSREQKAPPVFDLPVGSDRWQRQPETSSIPEVHAALGTPLGSAAGLGSTASAGSTAGGGSLSSLSPCEGHGSGSSPLLGAAAPAPPLPPRHHLGAAPPPAPPPAPLFGQPAPLGPAGAMPGFTGSQPAHHGSHYAGDQFSMIDSNQDGIITRGEFQQAFQSGNLRLPSALVQMAASSLSARGAVPTEPGVGAPMPAPHFMEPVGTPMRPPLLLEPVVGGPMPPPMPAPGPGGLPPPPLLTQGAPQVGGLQQPFMAFNV